MSALRLVAAFSCIVLLPLARAEIFLAQGAMSGEPTPTSVLLQTRLTAISGPTLDANGDVPGAAGVACFEYGTKSDLADAARTPWINATAESDFIVRAQLTNLRP